MLQRCWSDTTTKVLITISIPQQLFAAGIQARDIYFKLKKYFSKDHSSVTREEILARKFRLWVDMRTNTDNVLIALLEQWKSSILLQIKKQ